VAGETPIKEMKPGEVEERLSWLLNDAALDDEKLLGKLKELSASKFLGHFTWWYGPRLYSRNKTLFRAFILAHFRTTGVGDGQTGPVFNLVPWGTGQGKGLALWLDEADRSDDVLLTRQLIEWKVLGMGWKAGRTWLAQELVTRMKAAQSVPVRDVVMAKFDVWLLELDEQTAIRVYRAGADQTRAFILRHLAFMWDVNSAERMLARHLHEKAIKAEDYALADVIYRRRVPMAKWERDAVEMCKQIPEPALLMDRLRRTEPIGPGVDLKYGLIKILEARGKDVLPYAVRSVHDASRGWQGKHQAPYLEAAKTNKWWELWAQAARTPGNDAEFSEQVEWVLMSPGVPALAKRVLLGMLANVAADAGHSGLGVPKPVTLGDKQALMLYKMFPEILRGPLRAVINYNGAANHRGYQTLITEVGAKQDWAMLDSMASQVMTLYVGSTGKNLNSKVRDDLERFRGYFKALKEKDPGAFALRAAGVLSLLRSSDAVAGMENPVARLFLSRTRENLLSQWQVLCDMAESANDAVRGLAFKTLAVNDPRAKKAALTCVDALMGVMLAPLNTRMRRDGLAALANAGEADLEAAKMILPRAQDALEIADRRYPRQGLVSLIGRLMGAWPELAAGAACAAELTVFGREAKVGA
jgi:hypothetical protein